MATEASEPALPTTTTTTTTTTVEEQTPSSATNTAAQTWQEPQYEAALAHLAHLQEQIDALRPALRSLVTPVLRNYQSSGNAGTPVSKAQVFAEIKGAAARVTDNARSLREAWGSERTGEVLEKVKGSLEGGAGAGAGGDLSAAQGVERWGWG